MSQKQGLLFCLFLGLMQIGLIAFGYFQYAIRQEGDAFGVLPDQKTFSLTILDRPNVSNKALLSWATLAATASFTIDFVNYKNNLESLKDFFTKGGYDNFLSSLQAADALNEIIDKQLVVTAVSIGPAIILAEDEIRGYHTWQIEVPLLVRYQSASANETRQKIVSLLVTQVPTTDAPKGIGIATYITYAGGPDITS